MSGITAVQTAYRRADAIQALVEAIRAQTIPASQVWLWVNAPNPTVEAVIDAAKVHRVLASSANAYFHARFALALTAPTEYVAIFDDDSIPGPRWFENCLRTMERTPGILGEPAIVGTNGEDIELAARATLRVSMADEDVAALVPTSARTILYIGYTHGAIAASLSGLPQASVQSIEPDRMLGKIRALTHSGSPRVPAQDSEDDISPNEPDSFDCVICDALDQFRDSSLVLQYIRQRLRPHGMLIVSVPNVRHHSVIEALIEGLPPSHATAGCAPSPNPLPRGRHCLTNDDGPPAAPHRRCVGGAVTMQLRTTFSP